MKIAFLGLGIMGSRMARRLASAGMNITVWNRSASALDEFWNDNISAKSEITQAVENVDVVITMLSTPQVIDEVAFGKKGFISKLKEDTIWINSSTIDPKSAIAFGENSKEAGIRYVDAPVAGTKQPAENGELVFLIGSDTSTLEEVKPILEVLGKKTIHLGEIGKGTSMKMLVNLMLAQSMTAFAETVKLGRALGLEQSLIHKVLTNTPVAAPFLSNIVDKLEQNNTEPNFPLKWMLKDIRLAQSAIDKELVITKSVASLFERSESFGMGDQDFSSVYHFVNSNQQ